MNGTGLTGTIRMSSLPLRLIRATLGALITSSLVCPVIVVSTAPASADVQSATVFDTRIACSQERGQALGECTVRVTFEEGGVTTVIARFANGFSRSLRFERGEFVRADATMSGSGTDTDWQLERGLHRIRVDDQRYEVPVDLVAERRR